MHRDPDQFDGQSLEYHLEDIARLIARLDINTILDYGSGKGLYWPEEILGRCLTVCYDPGVDHFSRTPSGKFDLVVSTDCLEHCDQRDIPWIVAEMVEMAEKHIFINVATYEAVKVLPGGENAHITVRSAQWWSDTLLPIIGDLPFTLTCI